MLRMMTNKSSLLHYFSFFPFNYFLRLVQNNFDHKKTRIHHAGFLLRSFQSFESALAQLTLSVITYDRDEQLAS